MDQKPTEQQGNADAKTTYRCLNGADGTAPCSPTETAETAETTKTTKTAETTETTETAKTTETGKTTETSKTRKTTEIDLTQPPETFRQLLWRRCRQATRPAGWSHAREAASVLSTAQRHTHFLDSTSIAEATSRTDFRFADLARSTGSVFLVLPPDRIPTHARWLRILVAQALGEILRLPEPSAKPVLFLLDECAALGRMPPLKRAVGLMAGYGMQVWTIFQDLHQLCAIYGKAAGTFLSNAGIVQAFNVNDLETARWISSMLGADTEVYGGGAGRDSRFFILLNFRSRN